MRYVITNITKVLTFIIIVFIFNAFLSCTKEKKEYPNPSIDLISEIGFTSTKSTFLLGDSVVFGFTASTNSDVALTHFNLTIEKDDVITSIDSGIYNQTFRYEKKIRKGLARNEKWSFYTTDRDGRKSSLVSVELLLDSASIFGDIKSFPNVILGAQKNTTVGGFYSFSFEEVYSLTEAFTKQDNVDLLYFYDFIEGENNTLSSPGANLDASVFEGDNAPSLWTVKNTTRFVFLANVGAEDFDQSKNDSLILANAFEFPVGKRKAKNLAKDHIYAFQTEKGLQGLFKVLAVEDQGEGTIQIALKTQNND